MITLTMWHLFGIYAVGALLLGACWLFFDSAWERWSDLAMWILILLWPVAIFCISVFWLVYFFFWCLSKVFKPG